MKRVQFCCYIILLFLVTSCSLPDLGQPKPEGKQIRLKHEPSYIEPVPVEEQLEEPVYTNQS